MMQYSAFTHTDIGTNYDALKKNLIKFFLGGSKASIVRQIAHTVEALHKNASTKPIWDGMVEGNQLATDCLKSLKDTNWVENCQMSEDNLRKFLEFLFY